VDTDVDTDVEARVQFGFSEEQEELRRTVRAFLEQRSPEAEVRRVMDTVEGFDGAVWDQMGRQLGLQGLAVPEELGGTGSSFRELGIVLEEMGRALLPAPFFATAVLAAGALLHSGDDAAQKDLLPGIAAGETIATLAFAADDGRWDDLGSGVTAASGALSGTAGFVLDGHVADLLLVVARGDAGPSLYAVTADADGLERTPLFTMDQTRKLARVRLSSTPARLVGAEGAAGAIVERTLRLAAVGLAHEQVGGAHRCLEMATQYAKDRIQFGRPIGSFQAVKHKCADMLVAVELARSAAYYAAWCAATEDDDLAVAAAMAKSYCSEAYLYAAAENIQVHGGIGFTWEHPAHLYLKRAKSSQLLFGDPRHHRKLLAQRVGI
jgi:alkylation response protein AidB-like acyl-CoA dehydrogenase